MSISQKRVLVFLAVLAVVLIICGITQVLPWRSVALACLVPFFSALSVIHFGKNWK